ncbi:macro domain-containing protein [Endozoicomonas sp. ONNA2]|uniref:macro domain-containing protein n=1 Tax=Endozoicomonas sp. ONNA2 TaxID=2828741 RepID=UPI002148B3AE|nr:macro domain-containing protein [Endozoicomonas sp. ONNA2]
MDGAINRFCETLRLSHSLRLEECGIDQNNQFVFGRKVEFGEYKNLIRALSNNPDLRHLANKSVVCSQDLPSLNYLCSANEVNRTLRDGVTLATCNNGLLAWVRRKNIEQAYGIVNSVDWRMQLNRGIAQAIKDKLGGNDSDYYQASQQNRIHVGECFTFDLIGEGKPPDLTNCQAVHNVLVPVATDGAFINQLKDAVFKVFQEADGRGLRRIFCPLLGCGNAGGSGQDLATAVALARDEFRSTGKQVPELILVGMSSSDKDKKACKAFEQEWNQLVLQNPATPSRPPASQVPSAGASTSLSAAVTETPLDPGVTLVTCMGGLLTWVGRENANARISYGIVNSVDLGKTLSFSNAD